MRTSKAFDYLSKRKAPHVRHTLWYISLTLGTLSIEDERDDEDELHLERTRSRTSFTARKFES